MRTLTLGLLALAMIVSTVDAQAQQKKGPRTAEQVQKEIDATKAKLKELEIELAKLKPPVRGFKALPFASLTVGDVGLPLGVFRIREIVSEDTIIVTDDDRPNVTFVIRGRTTKGEAEDKLFSLSDKQPWTVTKTEKIKGKTYYVIEPFKEPKPKE